MMRLWLTGACAGFARCSTRQQSKNVYSNFFFTLDLHLIHQDYLGFAAICMESIMAPRPYWKGYLKLSLVACPVAVFTATTSSERVLLRQIRKKTGLGMTLQ